MSPPCALRREKKEYWPSGDSIDDEHDIALLPPPHDQDPGENWRWPEQWLPHGAWLMLALAAQQAALAACYESARTGMVVSVAP